MINKIINLFKIWKMINKIFNSTKKNNLKCLKNRLISLINLFSLKIKNYLSNKIKYIANKIK